MQDTFFIKEPAKTLTIPQASRHTFLHTGIECGTRLCARHFTGAAHMSHDDAWWDCKR